MYVYLKHTYHIALLLKISLQFKNTFPHSRACFQRWYLKHNSAGKRLTGSVWMNALVDVSRHWHPPAAVGEIYKYLITRHIMYKNKVTQAKNRYSFRRTQTKNWTHQSTHTAAIDGAYKWRHSAGDTQCNAITNVCLQCRAAPISSMLMIAWAPVIWIWDCFSCYNGIHLLHPTVARTPLHTYSYILHILAYICGHTMERA